MVAFIRFFYKLAKSQLIDRMSKICKKEVLSAQLLI